MRPEPCESSTGLRLQTTERRYRTGTAGAGSLALMLPARSAGDRQRGSTGRVMPRCVPIPNGSTAPASKPWPYPRGSFRPGARIPDAETVCPRSSVQSTTFSGSICSLPQPLSWEDDARSPLRAIIDPSHTGRSLRPAGSAPLPSAVIMLAVPARIAGCPHRILCTHHNARWGRKSRSARSCTTVRDQHSIQGRRSAGHSCPRLRHTQHSEGDKIFGPGNAWVTAAKAAGRRGSGRRRTRSAAGALRKVMVVADETARADFVAGRPVGPGRT